MSQSNSSNHPQNKVQNSSRPLDGLWLYVLLTFALSWITWGIGIASGMSLARSPGILVYSVGGSFPSIIGVILLYRYTPQGERDFWRRLVSFKQISAGWWAFIVLWMPAIMLLSVGISYLLDLPAPGYVAIHQIAANPAILVTLLLQFLIIGPLTEELGWRGFALDRILGRWGVLRGSLILAFIWWAWHLPLYYFIGSTYYRWGLFTPEFWLFLLRVIPLTTLMSLAYLANQRSILSALAIHFTFNSILNLIAPLGASLYLLQAIFMIILVAGVWFVMRKHNYLMAPTATVNLKQ
jgi:membrane protease YdiL (CAAX protease family)